MGFDTFEKVKDHVYKCKTCGVEVESGIVNLSEHYASCTGKELHQTLKKLFDAKPK